MTARWGELAKAEAHVDHCTGAKWMTGIRPVEKQLPLDRLFGR
jgi:hypothetical protein